MNGLSDKVVKASEVAVEAINSVDIVIGRAVSVDVHQMGDEFVVSLNSKDGSIEIPTDGGELGALAVQLVLDNLIKIVKTEKDTPKELSDDILRVDLDFVTMMVKNISINSFLNEAEKATRNQYEM